MKNLIKAGLLIGLSVFAVLFFVLDPEEHILFPRCVFYSLSGWYCPGCGSQRAIHSLLHLNISGVVRNNILFLPALIAILYHYLHPLFNRWFNWRLPNIFYLKQTPVVIFILILLFWVLRNLPFYPFSALAPG